MLVLQTQGQVSFGIRRIHETIELVCIEQSPLQETVIVAVDGACVFEADAKNQINNFIDQKSAYFPYLETQKLLDVLDGITPIDAVEITPFVTLIVRFSFGNVFAEFWKGEHNTFYHSLGNDLPDNQTIFMRALKLIVPTLTYIGNNPQ